MTNRERIIELAKKHGHCFFKPTPVPGKLELSRVTMTLEELVSFAKDTHEEVERLKLLDVTQIMLEVVPGDGDGHEVYAKSIEDVENLLSKQGLELENALGELTNLRAKLAKQPEGTEPVAVLHDDGHWTFTDKGKMQHVCESSYAGWSLEVYARPPIKLEKVITSVESFDHSIGADRFNPVRVGLHWKIQIGNGTATYGRFRTKIAVDEVCLLLLMAFRDGAFQQAGLPTYFPRPDEKTDKVEKDIDSIALEAAQSILDLGSPEQMPGFTTQWKAKVQCIIINALHRLID